MYLNVLCLEVLRACTFESSFFLLFLHLFPSHSSLAPPTQGEEQLRLLNLQHNAITRLQHLGSLKRLVFLDLYDNLVTDMTGLEGLYSLRVLMLGRNRFDKPVRAVC